jgi:enoyl-CoA hydratase/carnithine racemase
LVLNGIEAWRIGLANRVVPPGELMSTASAMGREAAQRHPVALRLAKALADAAVDLDHDHALRYDYLCWTTQMEATGGYAGAIRFTNGGRSSG